MLPLHRLSMNGKRKILGHDPVFVDNLDACRLEIMAEVTEGVVAVELRAMQEAPGPCEDGRDGVGGGLVALLPLTIVAGDSS